MKRSLQFSKCYLPVLKIFQMKEIISSNQNAKIKNVVHLIEKSGERKKQNLMIVEGAREIHMALSAGFVPETLFYCSELLKETSIVNELTGLGHHCIEVTRQVFGKIAFREHSDGLVVVMKPVYLQLSDLKLKENPLIVVLESVEKPGNLGAILRTADAAGADAVIVCDPKTDIYNPNCVRSSLGCVFTNQVVTATSAEVLNWCDSKGIACYAAALTAEKYYHEEDLTGALAIVLGTEANGLTDFWLQRSYRQLKIPMLGKIDSLNVSTSAAIFIFEAKRQRNFR
jgi:TrmH family RNA methyltransferase